MRYRILFILLALIILAPSFSSAQRWKQMRYEWVGGAGASNFLGELGGANQSGTDYFKDLEFSMTRFVVSIGMRYRITRKIAASVHFNYGMVSGNDNTTEEPSRRYRNLSFRSTILELAVQIEPALMKETTGHRYRLKGVKGRRWLGINTYPFIGIGVFYFNPKAKYNGKWYALQPLGTEGQGEFQTRKKYSRFAVAIPVGIGFKYWYNRKWSVGFEYGVRKTFTDYIDDVSTTYVDEAFIRDAADGVNSDIAVELADRSEPVDPGDWKRTAAGQQRGDPTNTDTYMFAKIMIAYKFRVVKISKRKRPKF